MYVILLTFYFETQKLLYHLEMEGISKLYLFCKVLQKYVDFHTVQHCIDSYASHRTALHREACFKLFPALHIELCCTQ
jgi:hypothetical protein